MDTLKSSDWNTRKASSLAISSIAVNSGYMVASFKTSCLRSLEHCKFDKVKPVGDAITHAIQLRKAIPGSDTPEPLEAGSSTEGATVALIPHLICASSISWSDDGSTGRETSPSAGSGRDWRPTRWRPGGCSVPSHAFAAPLYSPMPPSPPRSPAQMASQMEPETELGCDLALQTHDCNYGGRHDTEIHSLPINLDSFSTPKRKATNGPFCGSSCTPECDENLKPVVGMTFESMKAVEKFYKNYAHNVGFMVRIEQKKTVDNVVVWR